MSTPREIHEAAVAAIDDCLCKGRPEKLCPSELYGELHCCRPAGHTGLHVACGGSEGPHGIASWQYQSEVDAEKENLEKS